MAAAYEVFFEATYSYRRQWGYYLFVGIFGSLDLVIGTALVLKLAEFKFDAEEVLGMVFASLWLLGTGAMTILILRSLILNHTSHVRIDSTGLHVDDKLLPWEAITDIRGVSAGMGKIMLRYHLRSGWPLALDRHLPLRITQAEYESLFERLDDFLDESFPHVETD